MTYPPARLPTCQLESIRPPARPNTTSDATALPPSMIYLPTQPPAQRCTRSLQTANPNDRPRHLHLRHASMCSVLRPNSSFGTPVTASCPALAPLHALCPSQFRRGAYKRVATVCASGMMTGDGTQGSTQLVSAM